MMNGLWLVAVLLPWSNSPPPPPPPPLSVGDRLQLFVDRGLIASMAGVSQKLHPPIEREVVLRFDRPWEGFSSAYNVVLRDGDLIRLYYRGGPTIRDGKTENEVTCVALSRDGVHFERPNLGLFEVNGTRENNVVLANDPACHNLTPFLDTRPGVPAEQRYKAVSGQMGVGLFVFSSPDGFTWQKLQEGPVFTQGSFDSQNVVFWSEMENGYVCYFRNFKKIGAEEVRWISRAVSDDLLHWSEPAEMDFGDAPPEHLYTNGTQPYPRAPHLYLAICARFLPDRMVLDRAEYQRLEVHPWQWQGCSDVVLMSSRGGNRYDRTFCESFIRPGPGHANWVARTNYPALGIIETAPGELSLYVQRHYAQPSHHLSRYTLRTDGFISVNAPYAGGELLTRPLVFSGESLLLNVATSAAGSVQVELQDEAGAVLPGFALADCTPIIGDAIAMPVRWKGGSPAGLAGQPVRLRFVMKDADLYAMRFR